MKHLKQLFWIFLFSFLGEFLSSISPIAIPGSVIGLVLLFLALHFHWLKMEQVETVGEWLTDNMAILFIPPGVALMTHFALISEIWAQLILIIVATTAAMIAVVAWIVQRMKRVQEKKQMESAASLEGEKIYD